LSMSSRFPRHDPLGVPAPNRLVDLPSRFARIEHEANAKTITAIPQVVHSAVSPSVYAYTRQTTRRNLYRIELPD